MTKLPGPGPAVLLWALAGLLGYSATVSAQAAPWVGKALSGAKCEGGRPPIGPHDYLNRPAVDNDLRLVEDHHFDRGVETLTKGMTSTPMGDIDYVLRAFPNHHRALQSVTDFSLRHNKWPKGSNGLPAECYLQRAMEFSPRDPVPYKIYGYYMHRKNRLQLALEANQKVMELAPSDVMVHYNTGLILVELERHEEALEVAKPLYEAGLTLPGLKNKLVKAGVWEHSPEEVEAYKALLRKKAAGESAGDADTDTAHRAGEDSSATGDGSSRQEDAAAASTPEPRSTETSTSAAEGGSGA